MFGRARGPQLCVFESVAILWLVCDPSFLVAPFNGTFLRLIGPECRVSGLCHMSEVRLIGHIVLIDLLPDFEELHQSCVVHHWLARVNPVG